MDESRPGPSLEELLARDDWAAVLGPYEALGQRFRVLVSDPALAAFLEALYEPMQVGAGTAGPRQDAGDAVAFRVVAPADGRAGAVARDGDLLGTSMEPARILGLLQWALNRRVIEEACVDRLILHAGGVDRGGRAVLVAGRMEAGKSTLTAGLLGRGFGYLSDEAVAVATDLTVEGYGKPLSIDPGSWPVLSHLEPELPAALKTYLRRQWQVAVSSIAPVVFRSRLTTLVLTRYQSGAETTLERATPSWALAELAHCTFVPEGQLLGAARLRVLATLVERVPVYRLVSGDLQASTDAVVGAAEHERSPAP